MSKDLTPLGDEQFLKARYPEAIEIYRKVLRNRPGHTHARNNLAASLLRTGYWEEAVEQYKLALPNPVAELNIALLNMYDGRIEEARTQLHQVIAKDPGNPSHHHDLACLHLLNGEWEEGWEEYTWRWLSDQASHRPPPSKEWTGDQNLESILLITEQGFGDDVMFLRYAEHVRPRRLLVCKEPWRSLLGSCPFVDETPDEGVACAYASLMSLPLLTRHFEPYWSGQYLPTPPDPMDFGPGFNVGICWKGNPTHRHDLWRSATAEVFAPLATIPGVNLVSLQVPVQGSLFPVQTPRLQTYSDTARAIAGLDLVITVDTSVAHLAGAMNVPTWVLVSRIPDWRHGLGRTDSPWYPSWTLYRQKTLMDWVEVMGRVYDSLCGYAVRTDDVPNQRQVHREGVLVLR